MKIDLLKLSKSVESNSYLSSLNKSILIQYLKYSKKTDPIIIDFYVDAFLENKYKSKESQFKKHFKTQYFKDKSYHLIDKFDPNKMVVNELWSNSKDLGSKIINSSLNIEDSFSRMPYLKSTNLYIDPIKSLKTFFINNERYVIKKTKNEIESIEEILLLTKLLEKQKVFKIPEIAVLKDQNKSFVITPWLGKTQEDNVKEGIDLGSTQFVLDSNELFKKMLQDKIYWMSLAPRNVIKNDVEWIIIDFEKTFAQNSERYLKMPHYVEFIKIWFSDIYTDSETRHLFPNNFIKINYDQIVNADDFEIEWYAKNQISIKEKLDLIQVTKLVEKRRFYKSTPIYGHNIGAVVGDFFEIKNDIQIHKLAKLLSEEDFTVIHYFIHKLIECNYFFNVTENDDFNFSKTIFDQLLESNRDLWIPIIKQINQILISNEYSTYATKSIFSTFLNLVTSLDKKLLSIEDCNFALKEKEKYLLNCENILDSYLINNIVDQKKQFINVKSVIINTYTYLTNNKKIDNFCISITGSYLFKGNHLLSDIDGYYHFENSEGKKLFTKHNAILKSIGIFFNQNFLPIINQYYFRNSIEKLAKTNGIELDFKKELWTEHSEEISMEILEKYGNVNYTMDYFIKFMNDMFDSFKEGKPMVLELDAEMNLGFELEYICGDASYFNKYRISKNKIDQNLYKYNNSEICNDIFYKNILKLNLFKTKNYKQISFGLYYGLSFLYWNKLINKQAFDLNKTLAKIIIMFVNEISKIIYIDKKYVSYYFYFVRDDQISLKKIKINYSLGTFKLLVLYMFYLFNFKTRLVIFRILKKAYNF